MLASKIYAEEWEIDKRLSEFGLTRSELIEVVRSTLAERLNTVEVDVINAPGMLSYIHGTRHLRFLLLSKGYKIHRGKNVESCVHPETGVKIIFQNVDQAAVTFRGPKAVSGKRSGSAEAIQNAQGSLFSDRDLPEVISPSDLSGLSSSVWYLCVSFDERNVRAELSMPVGVKNGNFSGFLERIFIVDSGDWAAISFDDINTDEVADFEPEITRKQSNV